MGKNAVPNLAHGQAEFLKHGIQVFFIRAFHKWYRWHRYVGEVIHLNGIRVQLEP